MVAFEETSKEKKPGDETANEIFDGLKKERKKNSGGRRKCHPHVFAETDQLLNK